MFPNIPVFKPRCRNLKLTQIQDSRCCQISYPKKPSCQSFSFPFLFFFFFFRFWTKGCQSVIRKQDLETRCEAPGKPIDAHEYPAQDARPHITPVSSHATGVAGRVPGNPRPVTQVQQAGTPSGSRKELRGEVETAETRIRRAAFRPPSSLISRTPWFVSNSVILKQGWFYPSGNVWQCLQTFFFFLILT